MKTKMKNMINLLVVACLTIFVALDEAGKAKPVPRWRPHLP